MMLSIQHSYISKILECSKARVCVLHNSWHLGRQYSSTNTKKSAWYMLCKAILPTLHYHSGYGSANV